MSATSSSATAAIWHSDMSSSGTPKMVLTFSSIRITLTLMTTRSINYYTIRFIVRCAFWGSILTFVIWAMFLGMAAKVGANCPIELHGDFTYTTTSDDMSWVAGYNCDLPENVNIGDHGNWWWAE